MDNGEHEPRRSRLFIGFELPRRQRAAIGRWQEKKLSAAGLRLTPPENLHMTLNFLGETDSEDIPRIAGLLSDFWYAPYLEFKPKLTRRPSSGPTRLLALADGAGGVDQFVRELDSTLLRLGIWTERKKFWAHVTVARVRSENGHPMVVKPLPVKVPEELTKPFQPVRMTLYLSLPGPAGSEYVSLAQTQLMSTRTEVVTDE